MLVDGLAALQIHPLLNVSSRNMVCKMEGFLRGLEEVGSVSVDEDSGDEFSYIKLSLFVLFVDGFQHRFLIRCTKVLEDMRYGVRDWSSIDCFLGATWCIFGCRLADFWLSLFSL
jgi:hypothetical protein